MKTKIDIKTIVEAGLAIALATVLSRITIFKMPQGGSVTLAGMVPLIVFAIRHGGVLGVVVGIVYGIIDAIFGGYVIGPLQFLLDYPLAFASMGIAGFFSKSYLKNHSIAPVFAGTVLGYVVRLIMHTLSGVIFFAEYAGEQNVWIYSIIYNGTFLAAEAAIAIVVIFALQNVLKRGLD
ncbi:MAG: energy-coupled thiamine transporter ThiT [Ezakiella sp.]|nr:energy-coupled thiamine transporter ThiT [Bacillota bacterium]MDY3946384.1 energy-coupled thiamine transporter ThiT [Ezakiella sp.]